MLGTKSPKGNHFADIIIFTSKISLKFDDWFVVSIYFSLKWRCMNSNIFMISRKRILNQVQDEKKITTLSTQFSQICHVIKSYSRRQV